MSNKIKYFLLLNLFLFDSCAQSSRSVLLENGNLPKSNEVIVIEEKKRKDTLIKKYYHQLYAPVTIKYADTGKATILVLPGWNYSDTEWCDKTQLCLKAKKQGFNLVFVEMQRSVYLKSYYTQTRKDYKKYPTRTWLIDSAFLPLFNLNLIDTVQPVFVMGLSTGGRGAAILALDYPTLFSGAASLSGDFDPTLQKDDALMINSIGPFSQYSNLWRGDNNITLRAAEIKVPLFIGHGMADKVSPVKQSLLFVDTLRKKNPELIVKSSFPKSAGHNYTYWDSEVDNVLNFFSSLIDQITK
jgi:pimeloyl-ACP methyl ester carboxylesterase